MEETVPIIHSRLVRRNRNFSANPYGAKFSLQGDFVAARPEIREMTAQEAARRLEGSALQWSRTQSQSRLP